MLMLMFIILILSIIGGLGYFYINKYKNQIQELKDTKNHLIKEINNYEHDIALLDKDFGQKIQLLTDTGEEVKELVHKKQLLVKEVADLEIVYKELFTRFTTEEQQFNTHIEGHKEELEEIFQNFVQSRLKTLAGYDAQILQHKQYIADYNAEQIRKKQMDTQQAFYQLEISESAKRDVQKLMNLSDELSNPDVLLKLVYKTYFEKPMNDLLTRVVGVNSEQSGIYKITNTLYNEAYIGQTVNMKDRWRTHLKKGLGIEAPSTNKFYQAMKKYKPWNFTFEVLALCPKDKLNETEKYWIEFYQTDKWGYNSKGGNQ